MDNGVKNWLRIVRSLAAENAAVRVSLSARPLEDGGRSVRVRALALGHDGVSVIEEPGVRDLGDRVRPGTDLDVLAVQSQTRLVGRCRVNGYTRHALNEAVRVDALQLSPPVKVFSGQLRDFYRAPVAAGVGVAPVLLKLDARDEPTIERVRHAGLDTTMEHKARLVNISGGGMGLAIVVDKALMPVFAVGAAITMHAELPTLDKPLDLCARVVHCETLEIGDLYLGVAFVFEDPAVQKQVEDQLQRLSVWFQRRMLKKDRQD